MRKRCILLALVLLLLSAGKAAGEADSLLGTWYGFDTGGFAKAFDFREKGVCVQLFANVKKQTQGRWSEQDGLVTAKFGSEIYYFRPGEEDRLILDSNGSMLAYDDAVLTRRPYAVYTPAKQAKVKAREEFDGLWKVVCYVRGSMYIDLDHRDKVYGSFWSVYGTRDTGIYYVRIDTGAMTLSYLGEQQNVLRTHDIKWNSGTVSDTRWKDTYCLLEDGMMKQKWSDAAMYFVRADQAPESPETGGLK